MRTYCVYLHTNKINGKKYFGITCLKPEKRWNSGKGYSIKQPRFHNAIQKYGWNNFTHEILFEGLTKDQAMELEIKLIKEHNTTNVAFGYNNTIGGEGHTFYSTEEEKQQARLATLEKYNAKLQQDPTRLEGIKQHRRNHANAKYQELQRNPEEYERRLKEANERVKIRKQNLVEHQKILESKKRCKQKAMQDPEKRVKILEANKSSKQMVKALRIQLFSLYETYPEAFTTEDAEIVFTKFSPESGCFKHNSAKQLQQILNEVLIKIRCN